MLHSATRLMDAAADFRGCYEALRHAISEYEAEAGKSINTLWGFVDSYPFDKSFDELNVSAWVDDIIASLQQTPFTILRYNYVNTGGNCMVGIHEVWLPDDNRTAYVHTNEEGCSLVTVDYLEHDLELDDYDSVTLEYYNWDDISPRCKYFELFRRCYNDYLKDDCKRFGYLRETPYALLSDDLQKQLDADYLGWLKSNGYSGVTTDGFKIVENPYYNDPGDDDSPVSYDEEGLQRVADFKEWHNSIAGPGLYDEDYAITLANHRVRIPFNADTWDAVDDLLTRTIESW